MTDPMELVGRLTQRAADYRAGGQSSEHTAVMLDEAAACIREMVEKREGLEEDLYQAVSVAYHRGATEWARRNYPQWSAWIEGGRACLPPAPGAEDE